MAGQTRSRSTRGHGRSSRDDRSWPIRATAATAVSGSTAPSAPAGDLVDPPASTMDLPTRPTYQMLLVRGLSPDEAANLTAFMSGIHVGDQRWNLKEVNKLLFLRVLQRTGRFGETDGKTRLN